MLKIMAVIGKNYNNEKETTTCSLCNQGSHRLERITPCKHKEKPPVGTYSIPIYAMNENTP